MAIASAVTGVATSAYGAWKGREASTAAGKETTKYEQAEKQRIEAERRRITGERQEALTELKGEKADNQNWFNSEYYRNPLHTQEAQAAMTSMQEHLDEQNRTSDSRSAITGGTAEARIAQRGAGMKAMGELVRGLAAKGTDYRQSVQGQFWANKNRISDALRQTGQFYSGQFGGLSAQEGNIAANVYNQNMETHRKQEESSGNLFTNGLQTLGNAIGFLS